MTQFAPPVESQNYVGLDGLEFIEFVSPNSQQLHDLFVAFGFSRTLRHRSKAIDYYQQNDIRILLNTEPGTFASEFGKLHGPSASAMGWRVKDARKAFEIAVQRGAKPAHQKDYVGADGTPLLAVYGIGESLIYFIENSSDPKRYEKMGFIPHPSPVVVKDKGFQLIDHLTNNVYKGTMAEWSDFYKNVFGFSEIRYFDIRGAKTGLTSFALRSPCGKFCIPINEGTEKKSQINEYLEEYKGPGIQHIAFLTTDIVSSLQAMKGTPVQMLDMDQEYYDTVFERVKGVTEDHETLQKLNILVDGDDEGYLLQIFTKNLIGPIFIEIIQRKNHFAFGEGNFGALFRSIERDQMKRGYLA